MIDLDEVLSAHLREQLPAAAPPLASLRRRAAQRRLGAAGSALAVVALAVGLSVASLGTPDREDAVRSATGAAALEPRQPSSPQLGVVAGRVQEVPEVEQRRVTLRFTPLNGADSVDVAARQGGTWTVELPAGTWRVSAAEGGGVCQSTVRVTAGAWQRHDVAWPCDAAPAPGPPQGAPSIAGEVDVAIGERVGVTLDVRCGVGPIVVDGELFYTDTYAAPGANPPGWGERVAGWATRVDGDTVRFLAEDSTIRITFSRDAQRQPALCPE